MTDPDDFKQFRTPAKPPECNSANTVRTPRDAAANRYFLDNCHHEGCDEDSFKAGWDACSIHYDGVKDAFAAAIQEVEIACANCSVENRRLTRALENIADERMQLGEMMCREIASQALKANDGR